MPPPNDPVVISQGLAWIVGLSIPVLVALTLGVFGYVLSMSKSVTVVRTLLVEIQKTQDKHDEKLDVLSAFPTRVKTLEREVGNIRRRFENGSISSRA